MLKGIIFDIKRFAIHDGPGIRTTVFMKGCPLKCMWCHNPESQNFMPEKAIKADKSEINYGKLITAKDLKNEIKKDILFFDESNGGVTFSGGEPLAQPEFLLEVLKQLKPLDINCALDTSGYCKQEVLLKIAPFINIFLFDLKLIDKKKHMQFTKKDNKIIISNLEYLNKIKKNIILRFPLIPTITDSKTNLAEIRKLGRRLHNVRKIDVIPYHKTGLHKYRELNKSFHLDEIDSPSKEYAAKVESFLNS